MAGKLASYVQAGRAFDPDERAIAALELQQIDEPDQAEIDAAWDDEIDSRVQDILGGKVKLVDGEETMRMIRADLAARRRE